MKPARRKQLSWLAFSLVMLLVSCKSGRLPVKQPEAAIVARPGDLVTVKFDGTPSNSGQVVDADGRISLPYRKSIVAAGKTPEALEKEIIALYVPSLISRLSVFVRVERERQTITPTRPSQ